MTERSSSPGLQERLQALRLQYRAKLPQKRAYLETLLQTYLDDFQKDHLTVLRQEVHKLKGSGSTYGFEEISLRAKMLELFLVQMLQDDSQTADLSELQTLAQALFDTLQQIAELP